MTVARKCALLLVVASSVAWSGCGSSHSASSGSSDTAQVRATLHSYISALAAKNGAAACAELTPDLRTQLVNAVGQASSALKGRSCGDVINILSGAKNSVFRQAVVALQQSKVDSVAVSGNTAKATTTVSIAGKTTKIAYQAQRVSSKWLISCCVGPSAAQ